MGLPYLYPQIFVEGEFVKGEIAVDFSVSICTDSLLPPVDTAVTKIRYVCLGLLKAFQKWVSCISFDVSLCTDRNRHIEGLLLGRQVVDSNYLVETNGISIEKTYTI